MNGDFGEMSMDCISDAVSRFIASPLYLQPLLEFIDQHCSTFDDKEDSKLEYTIHEKFKQVVDGLISDYLASLGVPVHEFVQNLTRHIYEEVYDTLVKSILIVDDFGLFKDMMLTRNNQLYEEGSIYEPTGLELLEGLNITQASDLDEVIKLCYRTWEQQKMQEKEAAELNRAPFSFKRPKEEKDTPKIHENPVKAQYLRDIAHSNGPGAAPFSVIWKSETVVETSSVTSKPQNISLLAPTKANFKEIIEPGDQNMRGPVSMKRRDHMAQPRDQGFSPRKVEREKQLRMTDDSESRRSNLYLEQYLKRESLAKPTISQDAEAVNRREALMRELALKLKDELVRNEIKPAERSF